MGDKPLRDILDRLGGWPLVLDKRWVHSDWSDLYVRLRELGVDSGVLFSLGMIPDLKNTSRRILIVSKTNLVTHYHVFKIDHAQIDQPSFGPGSRDIVLKGENDTSLKAYKDLMVKSALKLGANALTIESKVDELFKFEILLAKVSVTLL